MKINWKTASAYWFVHFSVEVICFYCLYRLFPGSGYWWMMSFLYDVLAFAPQSVIGSFCEAHPKFRPGPVGAVLLLAGAAIMLAADGRMDGAAYITAEIAGLIILTLGNGMEHISGAFETLKVSDGRLSESAIFVGGGSFGVITGRLLSANPSLWWIPFVLMSLALMANLLVDSGSNDFSARPCKQNIAADRPIAGIVLILGAVVVVRAYIGYGLPTAWNKTTIQTICLFTFMGLGKMLGGILGDLFGARRVGIISCLVSIPLLIMSDNLMWLSLIAVAMFSMTMAITLGGLVSVLPKNPGIAFGVTTLGLLIGSLPVFFVSMPGRTVCNILIVVLSVLAAGGLWYCLKPDFPSSFSCK